MNFGESSGPKVVVLTPIRNESWVLETFLSAVSLWADHIILSDQNSTDSSMKIADQHVNVSVIANTSELYNEAENRKLLLAEARRLFGTNNLLFSLDADEVLSPEILDKNYQQYLKNLVPGTGIRFKLANVSPDRKTYWSTTMAPTAFIDDGRDPNFEGEIHFPRTCFSDFREIVETDLSVIHLQYVAPRRTERKHVWYQMWEFIHSPKMGAVEIYRRYHHTSSLKEREKLALPKSWQAAYKSAGVDIFKFEQLDKFWWDEQIVNWESKAGLAHFRKLDVDSFFRDVKLVRSTLDNLALWYLSKTQKYYRPSVFNPVFIGIYFVDRILGLIWRR